MYGVPLYAAVLYRDRLVVTITTTSDMHRGRGRALPSSVPGESRAWKEAVLADDYFKKPLTANNLFIEMRKHSGAQNRMEGSSCGR